MFHNKGSDDVLSYLNSSREGLSGEAAAQRLREFGPNMLKEGKKRTLFGLIIDQFKNPMVIVLIAAGIISGIFGHGNITDMIVIFIVVAINAFMGVLQESKAEKAIDALKKMSSPYAKVKRNGEFIKIKSEELVPGDIVALEAGDFIPADMRLIETASLKIEEAALTGESEPVDKISGTLEGDDLVIGDRKNMAYLGSSVTYGRGVGVVTDTGMKTEMGHIANIITTTASTETPLQRKLAELSKFLSIAVIVICVIIFIVGILRNGGFSGGHVTETFLTAISLAVAAIPEGLPAVVTIVLAMGVQRMASRNAIIRRLPAVETLGSTEIICSDKTGTLTQNKMTVQELYMDGKLVPAAGSGDLKASGLMMKALVLCNDSKISEDKGIIKYVGDPTETALVAYARDLGFDKRKADSDYQRAGEIPFDSDRKLMTTINKVENELVFFTKGAPDVLIERCDRIYLDGNVTALTEEHKKSIREANKSMAAKALRILAAAYKSIHSVPASENLNTGLEKGLIFVGLVGMIDPARPEVKDAVKICRKAGIRPVMITGDHRDTAVAIAKELGIIDDDRAVITGAELDNISEEDFKESVTQYSVYARVSPEHKVRIVKAWKNQGRIVAMTGDGVNDAPALKTSDIGVGMGITGTDVSKGVADMVLSDDNFATIVFAVEEGRKIYSNLRKTVQFLLSTNMSEVFAVFVATMAGLMTGEWPFLFTIQILLINLVTDSFPALALGVEQAEADIMEQPPRDANKSFFADGLGYSVVYQGISLGLFTLAAFFIGRSFSAPVGTTMAFSVLSLSQLFHAVNLKSRDKSIFKMGILKNKWLIAAFVFCSLIVIGIVTIPGVNTLFRVVQLDLLQWLIVFGLSALIIPVVEVVKAIRKCSR